MNDILFALWFFLPAGFGNTAPIIAAKIPTLARWSAPIDGGKTYKGKRILGDHKTWRGLIIGTMTGGLLFWIQHSVSSELGSFSDYMQQAGYLDASLWLGFALGLGALLGDAVKSFFKRQIGVTPGKSWFPFDQIDYIVGGCVVSAPVLLLNAKIYLIICVVWFVMHLLFSALGYLLHLKDAPI